jgi:hypothetical protein
MDSTTLVDEMVKDGGKIIEQLPLKQFEVTTGFWIKAAEDCQWYFYIVSPVVETEGLAKAYRQLHTAIRRIGQTLWVDPLEVKLIGPMNPIAQDVLSVHERHPGTAIIRWGGKKLGNVNIEEASLYPLSTGIATK